MLLTSVIFSLALLMPDVYGQTFCTGGVLPCVQNAECDGGTDACTCSTGFRGNGRVDCRDVATRCTCTALADPRFGLFDPPSSGPATDQALVKANLPCSVSLVSNYFVTSGTCLVTNIIAHPETRGTGVAADLRVFVKELEVSINSPTVVQFTIDSSGTTVVTGSSSITEAVSADNFQTATVAACDNLEVGYNGTYGGAYIDVGKGTLLATTLCGNCDGDATNENVGATNTTNLGYFLRFLVPTASQKGDFSSECGSIESGTSTCDASRLELVGEVCGRYVSDFGLCLTSDASFMTVTDFSSDYKVSGLRHGHLFHGCSHKSVC